MRARHIEKVGVTSWNAVPKPTWQARSQRNERDWRHSVLEAHSAAERAGDVTNQSCEASYKNNWHTKGRPASPVVCNEKSLLEKLHQNIKYFNMTSAAFHVLHN